MEACPWHHGTARGLPSGALPACPSLLAHTLQPRNPAARSQTATGRRRRPAHTHQPHGPQASSAGAQACPGTSNSGSNGQGACAATGRRRAGGGEGAAADQSPMVAAPLTPPTAPLMERARPAGLPGSQQLRIPTPQDLERMRRFRQQQQQAPQQQQRRGGTPPPPAPQRRGPPPPAGEQQDGAQQPPRPQGSAGGVRTLEQLQQQRQAAQQQMQNQRQAAPAQKQGGAPRQPGASSAPAQRRAAPRDDLFSRLADENGLQEAWRPQVRCGVGAG